MLLLRFVVLAVLFLALPTLPADAADLGGVARDFRPLSGYVIMPVGGEYLIDQDATRGVATGDLFTVVKPGEKIVHPVTKEVLGSLDEVKGTLQVTRVKSGYAYARPLGEATGIERGDAIRRYDNLSATFWDYTDAGEGVFAELKAALPNLEWRDYAAAQAMRPATPVPAAAEGSALIFILRPDGLEVRDAAFQALHAYAAADLGLAPPAPAVAVPVAAPQPAAPAASGIVPAPVPAPPAPAEGIVRTGIVRREDTATQGIWASPSVREELVSIEVADFDGDGQIEAALAYPHEIAIARLAGGSYQIIDTVDLGHTTRALRLDGADLDGDGRTELYLTAAFGQDLASAVIVEKGGTYQFVHRDLSWYFRAVALPGVGRTLLAQRSGTGTEDFVGPVFRVVPSGESLGEGQPLALPPKVNLFGFLPLADRASNRTLFARLSEYGYLQVLDAGGEKLWESSDKYGGSETYIERIDPMQNPASGDNTRNLFLAQRLEVGSNGEILVPANEGIRGFARFRSYKDSRLVSFAWDGKDLREVWHTQKQKGYLADFRLADVDNDGEKEIVQALVSAGSGLSGYRKSSLYVFEMQ